MEAPADRHAFVTEGRRHSGSTGINESTLTQLKIIVERAVRPVRASTSRKRKMREELLAHVVGVFEEESANLGDERTALEQTALRFGNPALPREAMITGGYVFLTLPVYLFGLAPFSRTASGKGSTLRSDTPT
jgi:hypothetical protein